ncbi:MAG TPA: flippase [bacterium]|nr:flippase [bacterium]
MNTPRKTAKNFTAVFLSEILGKLITFYAVVFYLAKYLSKDQFGAYNQVFVFISFCFLLATFGMDRIVVREIAKAPKHIGRITGSALLIKGILALASFGLANLVLSLAAGFLNYSPSLMMLIRIASLGILLSVFSVFGAVLHYRLRLGQRSAATVAARLLAAGAMIALVALHAPLYWFVMAGLLLGVPGALLGVPEALLLYIFYRRTGQESLAVNIGTCARLVKQAAPIALCDIFIITYARVDQIMLQSMLGKESLVGIYNFATRFAEVLRIIPLAFMASIFPSLCRAYEDRRASFEEAYRCSFKYMNLICIPVAFASIALSRPLILAINSKYSEGAPILTLLLFAEVFVFLGIVNNRLLVSSGRQTLDILFTGASAALNVALNLLLIGRLGMVGAALASLIAYATGPILGLLIPFTRPFSMAMFKTSLKPIGAACIMLLAVWLSADRIGLLASAALGAAVYLAAIALLRGLDREDASLVRRIFHKA